MVCASTLLKDLLSVNHCVIESCNLVTDNNGVKTLQVHLHPLKSHSDRCPVVARDVLYMTKARTTEKARLGQQQWSNCRALQQDTAYQL